MRQILLVCLFILVAGGVGATPGRAATERKIYLPMVLVPGASAGALPPEQLGVKIPVAGGPAAFFAGTIYDQAGKLAIWVPPNQTLLRGIFFANGTSNKPISSDPDWRNEVAQERMLAMRQLASLWGFAFVSGSVWDIPDPAGYFDASLRYFAQATGHSELIHAPMVIDGGSRFSSFCRNQAATKFPGRIIACSVIIGGAGSVTDANRSVPSLVIVGERDRGAETISNSVLPARRSGALIAGAMMWKIDHKCDRCQDLSWPWLDRLIAMRLPSLVDTRNGPVTLLPLPETSGVLGDMSTWDGPFAYSAVTNARELAWLPDQASALLWRGFVLNGPPIQISAPTRPYSWSNGFSQEPSTMRASQTFTLSATISAAVSGELAFYDGDKLIGVGTRSSDGTKLTLAGVRFTPGMHSLMVVAGGRPVSWPAGLIVLP